MPWCTGVVGEEGLWPRVWAAAARAWRCAEAWEVQLITLYGCVHNE
eukprot:SAG22_NODE_17_length_32684_cov_34.234095_16_plen_46_part_00